jgi:hypothetical protein
MSKTKETLMLIGIVCILFAMFGGVYIIGYERACASKANLYPKSGAVIYVDKAGDVILIEDLAGHRWIYGGAEDWLEGDMISMIMDSRGTEQIKDDEIVKIQYEGWREGE